MPSCECVLWPVRYCFERIPKITEEDEMLELQTELTEAMAKQLWWILLTNLRSWMGMLMFPTKKDSDGARF